MGHPIVDGSCKALACLPAAMQFESTMVLQCFCNRLCVQAAGYQGIREKYIIEDWHKILPKFFFQVV